ncbi:hypothetical protein AJ80_08524 [Polytolypa hystricis UAMH7299]|uniref:Uncharacterized protein n=1 Tax=Polytolypa hystricis (strain UAMH7299) TaxID=1447883 RepID=A0A2B7X6L9_POLH7|nr:hypothetical protein AJ80_08524 [Polytolypa hystricis UAMH7299]
MALLSLTPFLLIVGVLYLSSFLLFAFLRVSTGVSIQRLGYFSLRRIAYSPREGVHLTVRGLRFSFHRPTFARPTYITARVEDPVFTIDPDALNNRRHAARTDSRPGTPGTPGTPDSEEEGMSIVEASSPKMDPLMDQYHQTPQGETWKRLTRVKDWIKSVHRKIRWLALIDVVVSNTSIQIVDGGEIQISTLNLAVDTRHTTMAKGRLFRHKKDPDGNQRPAEWIVNAQNILLAVDGAEPVEIIDNLGLNIHGMLKKDLEGLRDVSIAVKVGRMHVPYDDLVKLAEQLKGHHHHLPEWGSRHDSMEADEEISFIDIMKELDDPGSREEAIVQTVADSKKFMNSMLDGIQEIQLALGFFRLSCAVNQVNQNQKSLSLNVVTHEVGIDFHHMDPKHPAHRMYFNKNDIAHQALLAAISLSLSLEDNMGETDKILYIPMATTTIKTTLPSKTVSFSEDRGPAERNTNVLFANLVVTSPSIDIQPKHLSQIQAFMQLRKPRRRGKVRNNHLLISRLLPKASIKLSVHEPVLRFALPIPESENPQDYNLLVSSISSLSLDIESSHSIEEGFHYSLCSIYRVASHHIYYQTASGIKHRLLNTETMEVKVHINATPDICVVATGSLNTYSIHLVSGEVTRGVHQLVEQFYNHLSPTIVSSAIEPTKPSFLRRLPSWLLRFQFEASGFSVEVAGIDNSIGTATRGMVLQIQGWTADYQIQRSEPSQRAVRRRTPSHSAASDDHYFRFASTSPSGKSPQRHADGRRLAIHVRGLEGFVVESADYMEPDSFLSVPRFEVALSTTSDLHGPIFHINSSINAIYLKCSLYRYYAIGIALSVLRDAFARPPRRRPPQASRDLKVHGLKVPDGPPMGSAKAEIVTVDVKTSLIQIHCSMPADPPMLLQVYGLVAGRHRWTPSFVRSHLVRLHAEAPNRKGLWARIVSLNNLRLSLRNTRYTQDGSVAEAKSIDISTDFIRIAVPHHMIMHRIFDNFVNVTKAVQQLNHRFKTRTNEYILKKHPEGPKHVPRISLRTKALLFELEDDVFEWKLGCIYRLGLMAQRHRLAREEAFEMNLRKIEEIRHRPGQSRLRTQSSNPYARSRKSEDRRRSKSMDRGTASDKSSSRGRRPSCKVRYNAEGMSSFMDTLKTSPRDAEEKLNEQASKSWKSRIDSSMKFQNTAIQEIRALFAGADEPPADLPDDETIVAIPNRPALLSVLISDVHLVIDKPTFPINEYAQFLHKIGKGMPLDMQYSLLIPMNIQLGMGEARANLRDYPLDLVHIPGLRQSQSSRGPSWSLQTNFVIAEEFRDYESSRHVVVEIIPACETSDGTRQPAFSIDVRRTVSPVKTYSDATIEINTSLPTSISWGMSYQPVIQDMMKIIEGFTKPEIDPSDRVGFWDKIRLSFHSRINVMWKGDGDVHLQLKGSRDPYVVTGFGAGFVMCFRKDVQWEIHTKDDPRELMTVTSGEYVLAVPDYNHHARHSYESSMLENDSVKSGGRDAALFKKVIMKLSGNVRWLAGLVFERTVNGTERCFDFKPHYDVVLRNPRHIPADMRKDYDAYRGFRSNHIHLSVAVVAPVSRVWSLSNREPSTSYNTVHLTPRFFTHFFNWWSLFSGVMSLPVRQGRLWPGLTKTSKKFGRHLATVKYNLFLSPLFVAHIYKHKDPEDYAEDVVAATGIKVRLDSFMLDLHQRRELVHMQGKGRLKQTQASTMKINRAQLDFIAADFRAISVDIGGTNAEDLDKPEFGVPSTFQQPPPSVDLSQFTIPDRDLNWIDMDDFVDLDWILPSEANPRTRILPLAYSPRFSYLRQTDKQERRPDETGYSPFGDEPTHYCVMEEDNDPRRVQMELIKEQLGTLDTQIESHMQMLGEQELRVVRDGQSAEGLQSQYELLVRQGESLKRRRKFLHVTLRNLEKQLPSHDHGEANGTESPNSSSDSHASDTDYSPVAEDGIEDPDLDALYASPIDEFVSDFDNRFIIHNIQLKWNNSLRNIILRYIHQVSQRRGFVYYMSRRAVKFILDIVEEQTKSKLRYATDNGRNGKSGEAKSTKDEDLTVEERVEQLLGDARRFVNAEDAPPEENQTRPRSSPVPEKEVPLYFEDDGDTIGPDFISQNSYHLRLIAPQIQLQSEKNKKAVALVTAKDMQLKVISIMDKHRVSDDVSGLVQRRFSLKMDSAQFFHTTKKSLFSHLHLYSGNRYGNPPGSAWPPWLSLDSMFQYDVDPSGFSRIIQKTSASLRFDKYNPLRLKYTDRVANGDERQRRPDNANGMDRIAVEFPQVRAICDSSQYYNMYIIVLDLLLYNEPLEKVRSERLEKIMLASDFSDLRGAPEMVNRLQQRIRQLQEIKNMFQIQAKYLDKQGWKDRIALEQDLTRCEDELFFVMKAITTSQRKIEERPGSSGLLRWSLSASEIVWHLMKDRREPLVEFQLRDASYARTDNADGSNHNLIEIQRIYGLNLLPSAIYPQMIVPYLDGSRKTPQNDSDNMLKVEWLMLEAIAGIPVLKDFEVTLFPLKVQLERDLAKKLFEYIFPGIGSNAFENGGFSPFMVKHMRPLDDESDSDNNDDGAEPNASSASTHSSSVDEASLAPGNLEQRLRPTYSLPDRRRAPSPSRLAKALGMTSLHKDKGLPKTLSNDRTRSASRPAVEKSLGKKRSVDSLRLIGRTPTDKTLGGHLGVNGNEEKPKIFGLSLASTKAKEKQKVSDDLSQMMSRASNYMTLTHVRINDVVLCLSYKGKGERNIEDVHNFVFRLPVLEYSNKTWSNLDLALRLKKDAIKALISHAPAILGNKFSHHKPSKQQQKRLRELASSSQVLSMSDSVPPSPFVASSDGANSIASHSSTDRSASPRRSFNSTARSISVMSGHHSAAASSHLIPDSRSARSANSEGRDDESRSVHSNISRRWGDQRSVHREGQADEPEEK